MRRLSLLLVMGCLALAPTSTAFAADLPDWNGWWLLQPTGPPPVVVWVTTPPSAMKPDMAPVLQQALANLILKANTSIDYCRLPEFVGFQNGEGFEDAVELLFTPGRVTLTNERGLVRRIHTDGRAMPANAEPTNVGTSIGRWEGSTLVVETTALNASMRFPLPVRGMPRIGAGARVTERISLIDANTLQIRSTLVAPELLSAPLELLTQYSRERDYVPIAMNACPENDRLIDPNTRTPRFDLTPPQGLPPPPPWSAR